MSKRVLTLMVVITVLFANGIFVVLGAIPSSKIIINGEISSLSDEMIIQNDSIYIPLASAGSELGYKVKWDADKREAVVTKYAAEYPANIFRYAAGDLDGIQLFALNKNQPKNEPLSDFILSVDGVNKVFKWAGQNTDRQPITSLIHDNNHIAIVTNTAAGTGIHGQKLYVVDKKSLEEISVGDISDYLKNHVEFAADNNNFTMTTGEGSWSLSYDYLDMSIANEWAKEDSDLHNLESYYNYMIKRAIEYQSYYIANDEIVSCLIVVKNEYGAKQQAIGAFKFDYTFNGNSYIVNKMDFIKFYSLEELNKWIIEWGL